MSKRRAISTSVRADRGRLRIEWQWQGKRQYLYTGLDDTKTNRAKLLKLQTEIEGDLENGTFDVTLAKYKSDRLSGKRLTDLSCADLFDRWMAHKSSHVTKRTVEWYKMTRNNVKEFFDSDDVARSLTRERAFEFLGWLREQPLKSETTSRRLEQLSACWQWARENHYVDANPWKGLASLIKTGKPEKPDPFTVEEIKKILEAFKAHANYSQLAPFVRFLFGTGCRTGEAIGLRWENVSADCGSVTIAEQLTKGQRKPTKGLKTRTIHLSSSLQEMMRELRGNQQDTSGLVFNWNSRPINLDNFRRRVWKPILAKAKIPYRRIYATRHTFISHALEAGLNPVAIAQMTGHDPKVLFDHYASVLSRPKLPDLF